MPKDLQCASKSQGLPGSSQSFYARIVAPDATGTTVTEEGVAVKSSDVSSITCTVYDASSTTPDTAVASPSITSSAFVTLVDNDQWNEDTTGYNFKHTVAGSVFTTAGDTYLVVYYLTLTGGATRRWYHEHQLLRSVPVAP